MRASSLFPFSSFLVNPTAQKATFPGFAIPPHHFARFKAPLLHEPPGSQANNEELSDRWFGCIVVVVVVASVSVKVAIYSAAAGTMGVDAFKTEFWGQHLSNIKRNLLS